VEKKLTDSEKLRKSLSSNVKKYRKIFGLSQEKLAEATGLSFQTINDIEGCRMWVSDKTITKLARVLQVESYQLLIPENSTQGSSGHEKLLALENKVITVIRKQFRKAVET
jgi:transcriptional regulator with XRE-family HTH domain